MSLKSESSFSSPSMMNVPLNILWRQCSELTCEKPNTSESVSGRPSRLLRPSRYSISGSLSARPSFSLYALKSVMRTMGSGCLSMVNMF